MSEPDEAYANSLVQEAWGDYDFSIWDLESWNEALQWRAHGDVEAWVEELYPFATGWRREALLETGEDTLSGHEDWGYGLVDCELHYTDDRALSRRAVEDLKAALAAQWREQCDWRAEQRRECVAQRCAVAGGRRPGRAARPRAFRSRRRRQAVRARAPDPDDPEPPADGPGGGCNASELGADRLQRRGCAPATSHGAAA